MTSLVEMFQFLDAIFSSYLFLGIVFSISTIFKSITLIGLVFRKAKLSKTPLPLIFLSVVLLGTIIPDSCWAMYGFSHYFYPNTRLAGSPYLLCWVRIAWGATAVLYQALALFIESLAIQNYKIGIRQRIFIAISTFFFAFFLLRSFYYIGIEITAVEKLFQKAEALYLLFPLLLSSIIITLRYLKTADVPRIISRQIHILILGGVAPFWLFDLLQVVPLNMSIAWITNSYTFVSLSNVLISCTLFYCARRMMGLRFLNFENHVQARTKFNFMDDFKLILEQFSQVTNMRELGHIVQTFFKEAFGVPLTRTSLYIRKTTHDGQQEPQLDQLATIVEGFLSTHEGSVCAMIQEAKVLIQDEIAFSNFYEESAERTALVSFMENISADIFLPIYQKEHIVAYIVVDRHSRAHEFYSNVERDQMIVFASYLGNIINLIQNKSLDLLIEQQNELKQELYRKHQEINQYKESVRSFLRTNQHKAIGIIFYKNRRFTFGNQAARELIRINPNLQEGHTLAKALKQVAHQVETYKSAQSMYAKDGNGNTLVLAGVPNLERNNVIITAYYPEISDIVKKQIDLLRDPSEWDYLLYLETTQSGKLINQLIPGSGEHLLAFKIELLKTSLSKQATLLDMPEEDLMPTVELLHHVSLRENLHMLELRGQTEGLETAVKLFGINQLFGTPEEKPLLERLNGTGTLFIKNIHFLDLESQRHLAEFIRYGFFRKLKSDYKVTANVRIICSTNRKLHAMVHEHTFSRELFDELKETTLCMPSLVTLPEDELGTLAEGFSEQAIQDKTLKNLLELTDRDKSKLADQRPASLLELKNKVQQVLMNKSKRSQIFHETQFNPAYEISDPELAEAARMGKRALKDDRIMAALWRKFKSQNKIATFLGVNRSSVNRRCKEYGLE